MARRRASDPDPGDRFRGLYVSDEQVDLLLGRQVPEHANGSVPSERRPSRHARTRDVDHAPIEPSEGPDEPGLERWAHLQEESGADLRLRRLRRAFGLDERDVDILLVAMAPDLDPRFERLYGYLQDDVTRRRASVGLALELAGLSPWSSQARGRLGADSPLCATGLLRVEEPDRPILGRPLRVPDRVTGHLLGSDVPDPLVEDLAVPGGPLGPLAEAGRLAGALGRGIGLVYFRERVGSAVVAIAAEAFARLGVPVLALDLDRLVEPSDAVTSVAAALRESRLRGAAILAGPVDALAAGSPRAIRILADAPGPVVLVGRVSWDPAWSRRVPWVTDAPLAALSERASLWQGGLAGEDGLSDVADRMAAFRLSPQQIERAERSARIRARADGRSLGLADLQAGARAENASGLDRLARRVQPRASWAELVLPETVRSQLRELTARARRRDVVLDEWGMGGGASHGRGITALFGGDPGTGKTMSAEVIAAELGLDLYVIDLSTVVDKYIGETEKNLDRIFSEADRINGVLLFDEADALFGQRSEVRDARDRYANVEIAYLLQRMEHFDGLAILTTNLRANIDEAFLRRLDAVIDFPLPEEDDRLAIWRLHLPERVPRADDLDLAFMAQRFRLAGGHIRNVCLTAAFLAAERSEALAMADLIRATEREYGKLGRLTVADEFGPYLALLGRADAGGPADEDLPR